MTLRLVLISEFIARNPGVAKEDLEKLIDDIMYRGISPRRRDFNNSNWSFGQSFLFTVTVVTTVGKDHTPFYKLIPIKWSRNTDITNLTNL